MRSRSDRSAGLDQQPEPIRRSVPKLVAGVLGLSRRNRQEREARRDEIAAAEKTAMDRAQAELVTGRRTHLEACGVTDKGILGAVCSGGELRPTPALVALREWLAGAREYPLGSGRRWGPDRRPFLVLCSRGEREGTHGTGKSLAGAVFLLGAVRHVETFAHPLSLEPIRLPVLDHRLGMRVTAERLRNCQRFEDYSGRLSLLDSAAMVRLLLLDELRPCDLNGVGKDRLEEVLGERYARELPTVITSNAGNSLFTRMVGERLASRFKESGVTVDCSGPDLRERNKERVCTP